MISAEADAEFLRLYLRYQQEFNWAWLPRPDRDRLWQLWAEILNDEDVQQALQKTLYIPWDYPEQSHGRFMISILDHVKGKPLAAPVHLNVYPDVRLTEATIVSIKVDDPANDGCVVTYTYPTPQVITGVTQSIDCVYVRLGNHWGPGDLVPCKFVASSPFTHRLKELTPDP
jgi:hypothetical protein